MPPGTGIPPGIGMPGVGMPVMLGAAAGPFLRQNYKPSTFDFQ